MILKLDIIEYQDGRKELLYLTDDGQTFMRDATDADIEMIAARADTVNLDLFGDILK